MTHARGDPNSVPRIDTYRAATTPHLAAVIQQAAVAHPYTSHEVAEATRRAGQHGGRIALQASGHGAGTPFGAGPNGATMCAHAMADSAPAEQQSTMPSQTA